MQILARIQPKYAVNFKFSQKNYKKTKSVMNINKKRSGKKVQSQYCDQNMMMAGGVGLNEQQSKELHHQQNSDKHELEIGGTGGGGKNEEEMKTMIEISDEGVCKANKEDLAYIQNTLRFYPWYHGMVLKSHVADVLKWDLSFVVRRSGEGGQGEEFFCLSVRINNRIYHYAFRNEDGGWTCPKLPLPNNEVPQKFAHIHLLLEDWSNKVDGVVPVPRKNLIIYHDDITMTKKLGEGAFGEVWKGTLKIDGILKDCAVKKIKGQVKRAETDAFFHEAKIMSKFDHECIVKYYGQCTLISPLMAVMELASGGTVRGLLRSKKTTPIENLVHFTVCIARGMEHISSKRVIHRDLAARNCLIGDNLMGENIGFRIAPIRWLAPETLTKGIFNEKTDVWSYGVVIWEIFTACAHHPLYPKSIKDAQVDIKEIDKPHKFPKGTGPPKEILSTFESCIRSKPENRPTFRALLVELAKNVEKWKKGQQQSKRKATGNNTATQKSDRKEKSGRKEKKTSSVHVAQRASKTTLGGTTEKSKTISLRLAQSKDKLSLRMTNSKDKISKRASKRGIKTPSK
ncbi:unnamed protein product [Caenorhabditis angaria]|uniref:Tyrosine-protein kinase n=1 Tax=Caenorhabditis angaria TaxID=860376 RepID=A0A9P1IHD8_9PELO|nr:unnamed protein product [Caenorhabditis angaria]